MLGVPRFGLSLAPDPYYRECTCALAAILPTASPFPLPLPCFPPGTLTIVTGAVGPGPAPARSDPVREGATGAAGWLRRWVGRRGPRWRGGQRRIHPTAPQTSAVSQQDTRPTIDV